MTTLVPPIAGQMLNRAPMPLRFDDSFASLPKKFEQPLRAWCISPSHIDSVGGRFGPAFRNDPEHGAESGAR